MEQKKNITIVCRDYLPKDYREINCKEISKISGLRESQIHPALRRIVKYGDAIANRRRNGEVFYRLAKDDEIEPDSPLIDKKVIPSIPTVKQSWFSALVYGVKNVTRSAEI